MSRNVSVFSPLPIDEALAPLRVALTSRSCAVLQAPPGAGKTTRVPLALLEASWLGDQRIVMLEPRRLAARAAARRMASMLGETVGRTVGFRVRGDTRVSAHTRIEVVTEGVLTRMLHRDAGLEGTGLVIFDEFHERSIHADLGLALTLETQSVLRPELRVLVMSATLDGTAVSALLEDAPIVSSQGRAFPVDVRYVARRSGQYLDVAVASAIQHALRHDEGSILAFLPGAREIGQTLARLDVRSLPSNVRVHPLFGALNPDAQDAAIAPPPAGARKVVLATSIAETSLTIEGVRVVIDGGLSRVPSFSPRTGMSRLETVRVSRAAADQRSGRAGRTAPGVCYRLWAPEEHTGLVERGRPEILEADLTPLALDLAVAGVVDAATLRWLDAPPASALAHARELLVQLGALSLEHRITAHGRAMAELGTHPRLAHMLLIARDAGMGATGCVVAALLDERDVLRHDPLHRDADLRTRIALVVSREQQVPAHADREVLRRVRELSRVWLGTIGKSQFDEVIEDDCGAVLALAYPDRLAQRRSGSGARYLLRSGIGTELADAGSLAGAAFLAVAELDGQRPHARIALAAPIERATLDQLVRDQVVIEDVVAWNDVDGRATAVRRERLGAIVLREAPSPDVTNDAIADALLVVVTRGDQLTLRWSEEATRVRARLAFLHENVPGWPDVGDRALVATAPIWLRPHLAGLRRQSEVDQLDLSALLLARLPWEQRAGLDALAPTHVEVASGSQIRIDYSDPSAPVLPVRIQELFGCRVTPSIAGGRIPLTLHLLSPAHRPVQVTRDLDGFWKSSYFEVRRELRGRYPRHEWPEDPLKAAPTRRAKPRR